MLERKLGISTDAKRKKRVNAQIEEIGFGTGFMDFLDGIEKKVRKLPKDKYKPQDYVFSDGEGPEEDDFERALGGK